MDLYNCSKVGELEADNGRLRTKMLFESVQKDQLMREMAFEKLQKEAALTETLKELNRYRDNERGRNSSRKPSLFLCFQFSDCSKVAALLAKKTPCLAPCVPARGYQFV